jgi:hypothetical protein
LVSRDQTDPLAPPAGRSRHFFLAKCGIRFGADDGARAIGADDDVMLRPPRRRRSHGVIAKVRHRKISGLGGRRKPYSRAFPVRACEAEPSDALRDQTDPLEPAGRRFANFFLESSF